MQPLNTLWKQLSIALLVLVAGITFWITPVAAQLPFIQDIAIYSRLLSQVQENSLNSACIRLDGRCLFKLSATDSELLSDRIDEIQQRFHELTSDYLAEPSKPIQVQVKPIGNIRDLYLSTGENSERLFTVTSTDARANDVGVPVRASQLKFTIEQGLARAKQERSPQYIRKQIIWGLCILGTICISNFPLTRNIRKLRKLARKLAPTTRSKSLSVAEQLALRQKWNLIEILYRMLQLIQVLIWSGGILGILNLYPQTRIIPFLLIAALRIPFRISLVALMIYFLIRLTYFLIAKLSSAALDSQSLDLKVNQRRKLRINTTTRILRSAVTIIWVSAGIITAFWVNGVNLAPLLTGAGILGLSLSFAAQNLLKDAINGFVIIWDDRYAVGDIVDIGTVSGLVENINLRITQLRDAEGRLITVPNSAVEIVANRSSQWSRADIKIPVGYQTNIDRAIDVIEGVAQTMTQNAEWRERIWEFPHILGVEQFSDRGILIRVWIKTEPLKQWEVAREFRRRVKIAFDRAGIPIPIPQQEILLEQKKIDSQGQNQLTFPD
ncbi:MAG: mechanosensitive ion channel family protein [Cyanobacteria bacterium P01_A01_bin.40]